MADGNVINAIDKELDCKYFKVLEYNMGKNLKIKNTLVYDEYKSKERSMLQSKLSREKLMKQPTHSASVVHKSAGHCEVDKGSTEKSRQNDK